MCGRQPSPKTSLEHRQAVNKSTAQWVPLFLAGIVGYVTWVFVVLMCGKSSPLNSPRFTVLILPLVHYLLKPGPGTNVAARPGAAIALIVVYFILFFPFATTWLRLFFVVHKDPGYVPQGLPNPPGTRTRFEEEPQNTFMMPCAKTTVKEDKSPRPEGSRGGPEKPNKPPLGQMFTVLDQEAIFKGESPPPPGLEYYYSKDVFQCDSNGLPIWCSVCCNWKPDRSHHCSDVGRCVMKLDHFCPWVGGVVAENNFKFFIQFNAFTMLYTLYVLIVMAYFVAETEHKSNNSLNVHWAVVLALGGLFFMFTSGMVGKSMQDTLRNLTTIDAIDQDRRTIFLAIHVDVTTRQGNPSGESDSAGSRDRVLSPGQSNQRRDWHGSITYPLRLNPSSMSSTPSQQTPIKSSSPPRTFAIIETLSGMNPWNLGPHENFKQVMGNRWYHWILPVHFSPCSIHDRGDSIYEVGGAIDRLKWDAGIVSRPDGDMQESYTGRRRRRRRGTRHDNDSEESMGSTLATVNGLNGSETRHRQYSLGDGSSRAGV